MTCTAVAVENSTVVELAERRFRRVNKESKLLSTLASIFVMPLLNFASLYVLRQLRVRLTDDAIFFKGASQEVWEANVDVLKVRASLQSRLEANKASVLKLRTDLLEVRKTANLSADLDGAISAVVAAAADLFESIENFRWTLLEMQANRSPISDGFSADSPEAVEKLFERLDSGV